MESTLNNRAALAAIDRGLSRVEPSLWLVNRYQVLKQESHAMRTGLNIAKSTSLAGLICSGGVGLLLGATGIGLVGGGIALLTYAATVAADGIDTGRFSPLPFLRTGLADKLSTAGSADMREMRSQWKEAQVLGGNPSFDAEEELFSNLPQELSSEAMMLAKHGQLVGYLLNSVAEPQRDLAYINLCQMFSRFGDAITGVSPARLEENLTGALTGDYRQVQPAELESYEPPVYSLRPGKKQAPAQAIASAPKDFIESAERGQSDSEKLPRELEKRIRDRLDTERTQAQTVGAGGSSVLTAAPPEQQEQQKITALDLILSSPFHSRAWFGGQRTGKSYAAAVASKQLHDRNLTRIFHLNLASYGDEDSYYWQHVQPWDSVCCDISSMDAPTARQMIGQAVQLVNDFYACTNALLICDEFAYIGAKTNAHAEHLAPLLHVIADKIATLASTGIKRQKAIWTLSPEYVAGAITKDALAIKKLSLVFCAIAPGKSVTWKDSSGGSHRISFDAALFEMVSNNFSVSPAPKFWTGERVTFVNGEWVAPGVSGEEIKK